jgi:hypothetical protein
MGDDVSLTASPRDMRDDLASPDKKILNDI